MQLINYTPFPAITWEALAPDGRKQGVLLVRGCFHLSVGNAESHLLLYPAAEPRVISSLTSRAPT